MAKQVTLTVGYDTAHKISETMSKAGFSSG